MIEIELPKSRVSKDFPLTRLLPNMLTLMSLCSGLTGIRFALDGSWHEAVLAIVIAGVFDVLDGRVARMLNIVSKFGAELDSLSDAISFGVAPGFILYEWSLKQSPNIGWIAVLIYTVCGILRLARFNTMLEDKTLPVWTKRYFTGVPAPGGAGLALTPLFLNFSFGEASVIPPVLVAIWIIIVGGLMVSRLPTLAFKGWRIKPIWVVPIMLMTAFLVAEMITNTWMALLGISTIYILSLPFGWYTYQAVSRREGKINA